MTKFADPRFTVPGPRVTQEEWERIFGPPPPARPAPKKASRPPRPKAPRTP